jgi:hypothetical protein
VIVTFSDENYRALVFSMTALKELTGDFLPKINNSSSWERKDKIGRNAESKCKSK